MHSERSAQEQYHELSCYTLSHAGRSFIHQNIVDAFIAQAADSNTKRIAITFAFVGLYLHVEKDYTGRQVQLMHMRMAKRKRPWPVFDLPEQRGSITVSDVLCEAPGKTRDEMIHKWCVSVWQAYKGSRQKVVSLLAEYGVT